MKDDLDLDFFLKKTNRGDLIALVTSGELVAGLVNAITPTSIQYFSLREDGLDKLKHKRGILKKHYNGNVEYVRHSQYGTKFIKITKEMLDQKSRQIYDEMLKIF